MKQDILLMGALGNSLGLPYEFYNRPFDITTFNGHRDDDVAQALMLAETLIECGEQYEHHIFLEKLQHWFRYGYDSLTNYPEGCGKQTREILTQTLEDPEFKPRNMDMSGEGMDGNGSLMRIGPVAMIKKFDFNIGYKQSMVTHNTDLCNYACRYFSALLNNMKKGMDKEWIIYNTLKTMPEQCIDKMPEQLKSLITQNYREQIDKPSGFVIHTLHAALYTFINTNSAMEGFEFIINLGGDTDTTACVYGYLAGAYYGVDATTQKLIDQIEDVDYIKYLSRKLCPFAFQNDLNKKKNKITYKKDSLEETLFEALRKTRQKLSQGMPPFYVCADTTLHDMVSKKPLNREEMLNVYGIRQHKYDLYGEVFIETIKGVLSDCFDKGIDTGLISNNEDKFDEILNDL